MSSKRQQIIDAIIARMQGISIANGYGSDLGASVHDFETNFDDEDLPALSICDTVTENSLINDQPTATNQIDKMPVQLRIFCKSGTRAAQLRTMISDVNRAIKIDPRWENLAMFSLPKRSGIILSEEAFQIGGAAVEIEIHIFNTNFGS
jgi:hypothetical protein